MKSHVALHPGTCPYSMHLPPLFVFHEQPHFRFVWWFLGYMLVLFYIFFGFSLSQSLGFTRFFDDFVTFGLYDSHPDKTGDLKYP
jgi:hypothetical protein